MLGTLRWGFGQSYALPPAWSFPQVQKQLLGCRARLRHSDAGGQDAPWTDVMDAATHECSPPTKQPGAGREGGELPSREKAPAVLPPEPFHSAGQQTGGKKIIIKKINKHHPLCLHLPLIYGPAEKPGCPQLLGSQLLFAVISSLLLSTRLPSRPRPATCCTGLWWLQR